MTNAAAALGCARVSEEPVTTGGSSSPSAVILLVDDSELVRGFTRELLTEAAYEVLEASSAPAAQSIAAGRKIDLLITDLLLPGLSGLDLARQMRLMWPEVRVLLLSADPYNAAAAAFVPGARFLEKTRMVDHLTTAVAQMLAPPSGS